MILLNSFNTTVSADVKYSFPELRFGLNNGEAFIRTNNDNNLNLEFDLQPFQGFLGEIGFLDVELTPVSDLDFNFIVDLETFDSAIDFLGEENLTVFEFNLSTDSQLPSSQLPSISGNIDFNTTALENAYQENELLLPFKISDITIDARDANSFVTGFLNNNFIGPVRTIVGPIIEELKFLTEPVPLLNDIPPISGLQDGLANRFARDDNDNGMIDNDEKIITLLDVIEKIAETQGVDIDSEFIEEGINLITKITSIEVKPGEDKIRLGDIDFNPEIITETNTSLSNVSTTNFGFENITQSNLENDLILSESQTDNLINSLRDDSLITSKPEGLEGLNIPILENPGDAVFDLLTGKDTDLINYSFPEFKFEGTLGETFPVLPPLGIFLGGTFDLSTKLGFGIDTFGLRKGNLKDGFFFLDGNEAEVEVNIGPSVGVGLQAGFGSVNVRQGYLAGYDLDLENSDTDNDGKVRLNEFNLDNVLGNFESSPDLSLTLGGGIKLLGVSLFSEDFTFLSFDKLRDKIEETEIFGDLTLPPLNLA